MQDTKISIECLDMRRFDKSLQELSGFTEDELMYQIVRGVMRLFGLMEAARYSVEVVKIRLSPRDISHSEFSVLVDCAIVFTVFDKTRFEAYVSLRTVRQMSHLHDRTTVTTFAQLSERLAVRGMQELQQRVKSVEDGLNIDMRRLRANADFAFSRIWKD